MARHDYSDSDGFYKQNFEENGVLSVWAGVQDRSKGLMSTHFKISNGKWVLNAMFRIRDELWKKTKNLKKTYSSTGIARDVISTRSLICVEHC